MGQVKKEGGVVRDRESILSSFFQNLQVSNQLLTCGMVIKNKQKWKLNESSSFSDTFYYYSPTFSQNHKPKNQPFSFIFLAK